MRCLLLVLFATALLAAPAAAQGVTVTPAGQMTLLNDSRVTTPLDTRVDGALRGQGTVAGPLVTVGGTLAPGTSPGRLTVTGRLVFTESGTYAVELAGTTAGTEHDAAEAGQEAALGGTVAVSFLPGFVPTAGEAFTILHADPRTGTFPTVDAPNLSAQRLTLDAVYSTDALTLVATCTNGAPVPLPDDAATTEGESVTFDPRVNDDDPDDDALSVAVATPPTNGSIAVDGDGRLTYTPNAGFSGADSFLYTVDDGYCGGTAMARVDVTVAPAPVCLPPTFEETVDYQTNTITATFFAPNGLAEVVFRDDAGRPVLDGLVVASVATDGPGFERTTAGSDLNWQASDPDDLPMQVTFTLGVTAPSVSYYAIGTNACGSTTDIDPPHTFDLPAAYRLDPAYPNPFNPQTTLRFAVREATTVRLTVYDALGRAVATLLDGPMDRGTHTVTWHAVDTHGQPVASGLYLARLEAAGFVQTRRLTLLK